MRTRKGFNLLCAALVLGSVLCLPSCRGAVEKARRNIRIEAVEEVVPHALSGVDLTVRVHNGSRYRLLLREASVEVWFADARVGRILLREGVEVPRRTTRSVTTRWKFRIDDPLALYALSRKWRKEELADVEVGFSIKGRGGPAPINIRAERMPLSDFLRNFGLDVDDLKSFMNR